VSLTPAEEVASRSLQVEIREWSKLTEAKGVEGAEALRGRRRGSTPRHPPPSRSEICRPAP